LLGYLCVPLKPRVGKKEYILYIYVISQEKKIAAVSHSTSNWAGLLCAMGQQWLGSYSSSGYCNFNCCLAAAEAAKLQIEREAPHEKCNKVKA
jgi:hypothetical protein